MIGAVAATGNPGGGDGGPTTIVLVEQSAHAALAVAGRGHLLDRGAVRPAAYVGRKPECHIPMDHPPVGRLVVTPGALADYRDTSVPSEADLTTGADPRLRRRRLAVRRAGPRPRRRGVSVDPAYELPPAELRRGVRQDIERGYAWAPLDTSS